MNKKEIQVSQIDIENATKFFDRTGNSVKDAYKSLDENIDKIDNINGIQPVFLYIPGNSEDIYNVFLN